jgi:alpha-L-fucosidase
MFITESCAQSNLGMDPFSYGYNRTTPDSAYMNASTLITSLLDIVSKNGNFLLDVGPQANGTIISVEQDNLREAGVWIKDHAEAIFNTTYWFITPEENTDGKELRFTQTLGAFYIISLLEPEDGSLVVGSPVPWVVGDQVTVVGGNVSGVVVPSTQAGNGSLVLSLSDEVVGADEYAWVFKIDFGGQSVVNGTNTTAPNMGPVSGTGKGKEGLLQMLTLGFGCVSGVMFLL